VWFRLGLVWFGLVWRVDAVKMMTVVSAPIRVPNANPQPTRPPDRHPQAQMSTLQASLADAERRVFESELIRRKLHNTIQVRARLRPPGSGTLLGLADGRLLSWPPAVVSQHHDYPCDVPHPSHTRAQPQPAQSKHPRTPRHRRRRRSSRATSAYSAACAPHCRARWRARAAGRSPWPPLSPPTGTCWAGGWRLWCRGR